MQSSIPGRSRAPNQPGAAGRHGASAPCARARPRTASFVCVLACCALLAGGAASAQTLTLDEFVALVARDNPELAAAREQRALAEGEAQSARAYPNPSLEIDSGPWRSRVGGGTGTASRLSVEQPLELPGARGARISAASAGVRAAQARADAAVLAIGYQARQAFYELMRRQEEERLARENFELLAEIQRRVLRRVEVGEAPRFELVRAEAEALSARNALAAAGLRTEEGRALLRRLVGDALPGQFAIAGSLPSLAEPPPLAALQAELEAAHPALRAIVSERERAGQRLEQERALRVPQPALRLAESRDPEMTATSLGVTLSVPLWYRRDGEIAQARAAIDLAGAQLAQQRLALLRELDAAHARFAIAQRQISTFEAGLLRSAETALEVAESAYRFGERSFLDVLDAQRTLRAVRIDYNQARHDRVAAWLDLERLRARDPFRTEAQ